MTGELQGYKCALTILVDPRTEVNKSNLQCMIAVRRNLSFLYDKNSSLTFESAVQEHFKCSASRFLLYILLRETNSPSRMTITLS